MDQTPNLTLPYIAPQQGLKHITHNEALRALDAIVQLSVLSRGIAHPPSGPAEGARYLVPGEASGSWSGRSGAVAAWQDQDWSFFQPRTGWLAWIADEQQVLAFTGTEWIATGGGSVNPAPLVGINSVADPANRLSVKSPSALFDHEGTDHRVKINKAAPPHTASLVFQTAYSGRAEFGLGGDDHWRVKTSADGVTWRDALRADNRTGQVEFPSGLAHAPTGKAMRSLIFTPGGDGQVSIYRNDLARGQNPRSATIASVSGDVITLTAGVADLFFNTIMTGVSLLRIWNASKVPEQSAWIKAMPNWLTGKTQLQVTSNAHIAGWIAGETIRVGDPASIAPTRAFSIDISPMLQNIAGAVFPQAGLLLKTGVAGNGTQTSVSVSNSAVSGSFSGTSSDGTGNLLSGMLTLSTTILSPISNSNLLFVREDGPAAGAIGTTLLSVIGIWA